MPWIQAHFTTGKAYAPLIEALFESLGALSVTLGDAADEPLLEPPPGASPLWRQTRVTGLFPGDRDQKQLQQEIEQAVTGQVPGELSLEPLADQVWERSWLDDFQPMRFGRRLWICPDGQRPAQQADGVFIDLDPGLAFGTGTHPTTALCLEWLDQAELQGKTVMDFGCGSGILAVAALKLGASRVIAVDHDPQALQATEENGRKNGVLSGLQICGSSAVPDIQVDLMLANILAGTLIELEPTLAAHLRSDGDIILSGILQQQAAEVSTAFSTDFTMQPPRQLEEWVMLEGRR